MPDDFIEEMTPILPGKSRMNVALIIFNRPHLTALVLQRIALAKPDTLFVIADGPRGDLSGDPELVRETRAVIDRVDWPCRVLKNYSDINMGCGIRPFSGISWVFEQVDRCIILEDDCLPDPSFFRFCSELLDRYENDMRVSMISGDNFIQRTLPVKHDSYYASVYPLIWGWATWRRAWQNVDFELKEWPALKETSWLRDYLRDELPARYWTARFNYVVGGKQRDIWDIAWVFACWRAGGMVIHPVVNLVRNIGWDAGATHTAEPVEDLIVRSQQMRFPLRHPAHLQIDKRADRLMFEKIYSPPLGLWERLKWRHTYGIIVRKIPVVGRMWSWWRQSHAEMKTVNVKGDK